MAVQDVRDEVAEAPEATAYLEQVETGDLFAYSPILARRKDMRPTDRTPETDAEDAAKAEPVTRTAPKPNKPVAKSAPAAE